MEIVYLASTLKRSGPTNQLYSLIKYLEGRQSRVHVVTLSPETEDSRWADFRALGVTLRSLNLSRLAGAVLARRRLKKLIDIIKPELIHTQGIRADVISSSLNVKIPKVATVRNIPQLDYRMTYGKTLGALMVVRHRIAMRKLSCCVGVSNAVADNLKDKLRVSRTVAIPNGVDTECFSPVSPEVRNRLRAQLGLPKDRKIWISTGHLSEGKDPLCLIDAFKVRGPREPDQCLLLVGGGRLEGAAKYAAQDCRNIIFAGRVSNVVDYLQASDYFVSASKAEGLPNAVLEAMACGLPVLLSNIPAHREIYETDTSIGRLFPMGSKAGICEGMISLLAGDYAAMQTASIQAVAKKFSAKVMSHSYQALYSDLVRCTHAV